MLYEFKIYDKEIIKINKAYITNVDKYNKCKFYFDEHTWGNKDLFVTFINKNGYSQTVILGKWAETLSCSIPPRMLDFDYFKIFCYTRDYFKTNTLKVYNTKKQKCQPKKSTKAIDYLMEKLQTKIDNIVFEDNQLKCYSDNHLVDAIYLDNVDEAVVKNIMDAHLSEFQQQIDEQLEDYVSEEDLDYLIISL